MKKSKGFTLIELLVVIAIIGILAVVILAALSQARKSAADAKKAETTRNVMTAVETYISANNDQYPAGMANLIPNYLAQNPIGQTPAYVSFIGTKGNPVNSYCILSTVYSVNANDYFYAMDGVAQKGNINSCQGYTQLP